MQLWRGPQAVWKLKGEPLVSQGPHERIPGYSDAWTEAGKWGNSPGWGSVDDRRGFVKIAPIFQWLVFWGAGQSHLLIFWETLSSLFKMTELWQSFVLERCITWNDKPGQANRD